MRCSELFVSDRKISGNIVDVLQGTVAPGTLEIRNGRITSITPDSGDYPTYLLPGFIDAHVHIESSMLLPSEFARLAMVHGTVATVSDPHEIANVLGVAGIRYMADNARSVPFKFHFGAPSCVPATAFETNGATVGVDDIRELFESGVCHYLSEVMNFPEVLSQHTEMMAKLDTARRLGKPIDGHAPGMRGYSCGRYFSPETGISTDHECTELEEAIEKIACGARILIREGSAAKNYAALWQLLMTHPESAMLCSDDKHPDDLLAGHINEIATWALRHGVPLMNVLRAACVNPVTHYGLPVGLLRVGDPADFIEVRSLDDFSTQNILRTWIDGRLVSEAGRSQVERVKTLPINHFAAEICRADQFVVPARGARIRVIAVDDGQLLTRGRMEHAALVNGHVAADPARDLLKIAVVNRYYAGRPPAVGFIHGFGIRCGAMASSVAHDSHNIVAVGDSDDALARAVNAVVRNRGGLAVVSDSREESLPLPVAGLMSCDPGEHVAERYKALQQMAIGELGATLKSPFMTLSFMALLVIPELKLSDRGLFDGGKFEFTTVCCD
jgi:adenine deaminase